MATTQDYINQLKVDKQNLVTMLNNMGVEATDNETFTSLTPKVGKIVTDPILQDKTITITENGTTNIVADEGFDGLNNVEVITNIETNSDYYINLLDTTDYSLGGWVVNSYTIKAEGGSSIYRFNKQFSVVGGETLYLSKGLCCYFNTTQEEINLTGDLIIKVPNNATLMAVRTFSKDFDTFNPNEYIISRTPIPTIDDEIVTYNDELTEQEATINKIVNLLNSKLQKTTE